MSGTEVILRLIALAHREEDLALRRIILAEARITLKEVERELDLVAVSVRALAAEIDRAEARQ